jgi:hypothetical protein
MIPFHQVSLNLLFSSRSEYCVRRDNLTGYSVLPQKMIQVKPQAPCLVHHHYVPFH